jgi:hypothetical protein
MGLKNGLGKKDVAKKLRIFFRDLGTGILLVIGACLLFSGLFILGKFLFGNISTILFYLAWFIGITVGATIVITILTLIGKLFWYIVEE